jgi:hypothetical protein
MARSPMRVPGIFLRQDEKMAGSTLGEPAHDIGGTGDRLQAQAAKSLAGWGAC